MSNDRRELRDQVLSSLEGVYMPIVRESGGELRPLAQWIADLVLGERTKIVEWIATEAWKRDGMHADTCAEIADAIVRVEHRIK